MEIQLRLEEEKDYRNVEEVTREAFWNVFIPGSEDHLLVHHLRKKKQFVPALDFVAICNEQIVGNIIYTETQIIDDKENKYTVLTFGPISVLPEYQNRGIGSRLVNHTAQVAKAMGYKAILIYGDPEYYKRFGFKVSKEYGITNADKKYPVALQVLELYPEALKGIEGIFDDGGIYVVDQEELKDYDKGFPEKEKGFAKSQERFLELVDQFL